MSLRTKFITGFGLLLSLLVGMGAVSYYGTGRLALSAESAGQALDKKELATAIELAARKQMQAANDYTFTGSQAAEERYRQSQQELQLKLDQLDQALAAQKGDVRTESIRQSIAKMSSITDKQIDFRHQSRTYEATDLAFSPSMEQTEDEMAAAAATLENSQDVLAKKSVAEEHSTAAKAQVISLSIVLVGLVLGAVTATFIARSITRNVTQMLAVIQEIAANNLAVDDLSIDSQDEIGHAGSALNLMKNNLRDLVRKIAVTAEHVAQASEQISETATRQAHASEVQRDQSARAATAMQEMAATVLQVSDHSNRAAGASRDAAETARAGGAIVEETLAKMRTIAGSVEAAGHKMQNLGKSSDQIGQIAGVIDDIADQTNLLALNAAIEAARAGAQGRGFAVVADEVRKLAERTTTATEEIAQMIGSIQSETKSALSAMEQGTRQVEDGVQSTNKAGESLKQIIHMSEHVGEVIGQIASMATAQSSASHEVNRNMDEIAQLVKDSATDAKQSAKACQDLSGLALDLQSMVAKFKLSENHAKSSTISFLESESHNPPTADPQPSPWLHTRERPSFLSTGQPLARPRQNSLPAPQLHPPFCRLN
jgi:methyl-accepting chemotaxis protein